jgi:hypothetical protein
MRAGGPGTPYGGNVRSPASRMASLVGALNIPPPLPTPSDREGSHTSPAYGAPFSSGPHIRAGSRPDLRWTGGDWAGPMCVRSAVAERHPSSPAPPCRSWPAAKRPNIGGSRRREKLVKIGARIVRHGRYIVFQLAAGALPRALFAEILRRIDRLRPTPPLPA